MEKYITLLFDRPSEPLFIPKGDEKINFEIPVDYLSNNYQASSQALQSRFGEESSSSVKIPQIAIPDLSVPLSLDRQTNFSLFNNSHRQKALHLTNVFLKLRTTQDLLYVAASCRDRMNPQLFVYALSVAIIHRPDTKHIPIPQLSEMFPDKFIDGSVLAKAKEDALVLSPGSRIPLEIPFDYTATDKDPEHRVAYFREDIGINLHHWHWHLVYPFFGPDEVVKKDRRGELLYYMHHQIMARYNTERLCNNLKLTRPYNNLREVIQEAYFPKMDQVVAGRAWPSRPANMKLSDINRPVDQMVFTISDIETAIQRVSEAIKTRTLRDNKNNSIHLDDFTGIDHLGNIMEASPTLSINYNYYGDIHNWGHNAIAHIHDPDHRYLEAFGIMGDSSTAMRDPIFYRWHAFVDDVFNVFKDSLPAYKQEQLSFNGIKITEIGITSKSSNRNTISTHWEKSSVDLSRGLDFTPRGAILARIQHLSHNEFTYVINVNNTTNREVWGTVRIFAAPKFDDSGRAFNFNDQRKLMIEMDKFTYKLKKGNNVIQRSSLDSSVTIPFEATFRDLTRNRPSDQDANAISNFSYCGCGWPQHMLVPKGTQSGYNMDLFVMISDYQQDKIDQNEPEGCRTGVSFCGLRDRKYPDARSMGYPFDRTSNAQTLSQFLTPNMFSQTITVRFSDNIVNK